MILVGLSLIAGLVLLLDFVEVVTPTLIGSAIFDECPRMPSTHLDTIRA
jgi:hypothetical protein